MGRPAPGGSCSYMYSCHNERFSIDAQDSAIRIGPGDIDPGGGTSLAGTCLLSAPQHMSRGKCDHADPLQRFVYDAAAKTIKQGGQCLTAGPTGNDT